MENIFQQYSPPESKSEIKQKVHSILTKYVDFYNIVNLKKAFSFIDLTSLNTDDTTERIAKLCEKVNMFHKFPRFVGIPNVASICVYPIFIETVKTNLVSKYVNIVAAAAGFPDPHTFLKIKCAEALMCIDAGANEIDILFPMGYFLEKKYQQVFNEITAIKNYIGDVKLKVILETGLLDDPEKIKHASILSLEAGADFIKTSTGKVYPPASKEALYIMATTVKEFYEKTGRKIGIKPAGGIKTGKQATEFMSIIDSVLGQEWLNADLFRIGASSLANNILSEIFMLQSGKHSQINHF